ncbi:hypothetical protein DXU07_17885 [Bradyrhizobium elkanii]|nr:hypothetical protein [Bradyrhizobium elkanii]NWL68976.1 hypothetical protein [Bradyrhizobium elkanii]RYM30432.1 hypothetical protein EWH13_07565 [Bradyrhizobium elkanii]
MGTGSREENASNRESRAPFRFNRNGISSRGMAALAPHPQRAVTERCLREGNGGRGKGAAGP